MQPSVQSGPIMDLREYHDISTHDRRRSSDYAGRVLELGGSSSEDAISGVGQITTLKSLGFIGEGTSLEPDGWYLPLSLIHISEPTRHFKRSRMPSSA